MKKNIGVSNLDELLLRMFPGAFGGNVGDGAFQDLEQSLLHPSRRHPDDGRAVGFLCDLVNFVNIDNPREAFSMSIVRSLDGLTRMFSTSSPTYPASVRGGGIAMVKGTLRIGREV